MNKYTFDSKERKAEIVKDSKPYFSFKLEDYNPQALSHCYAVIHVYAHVQTLYSDILSDMKFRNIHNSDVKVKNLKIERWESEDYEVTEREYEDYEHTITQEEWDNEVKSWNNDEKEAGLMLGGKVGDTVTRQKVAKEWQETRTKWLWKEYDPRVSKGLIPQGETVKLRISFDKPFDFYNQAESSVDWIPVVTKDTEIKEMSWFNSSWSYRRKFTSDNTKVASAYPYALILDLSQFPDDFFTKIKSGGVDIRITKSDGTTELARGVREVVTTAGSEAGFVYFHADGISTSADTDFYIYYGNGDATDYADNNAKGMENVFSSNYQRYFTNKDLTTSTVKDETGTGNGTKKGANEPIEATGKIGKGQDFDGSNDYINTSYLFKHGTTTTSFWVKTTSTALGWMFGGRNTGGTIWRYDIRANFDGTDNNSGYLWFVFNSSGGTSLIGQTTSATDFNDGNWHLLNCVFESDSFTIYVDGSSKGITYTSTTTQGTPNAGTYAIYEGAFNDRGTALEPFDGIIDEVSILSQALTANEVTTIYNNQSSNSTFWTVSSEETGSTTATETHTIDTLVYERNTETHTTDTTLIKEETSEHTVDTSVFHMESQEHTVDTTLFEVEKAEHTVDTNIEETLSGYSYADELSLPTTTDNLSNSYSSADETKVATLNGERVNVTGQDYLIHQFKDEVTVDKINATWVGQSTKATTESAIVLQVYNQITTEWETLISNNTTEANTNVTLNYLISDLTNYKDGNNVYFRVYQKI